MLVCLSFLFCSLFKLSPAVGLHAMRSSAHQSSSDQKCYARGHVMKLSADGREISAARRYQVMKIFMPILEREDGLKEMFRINMEIDELLRQMKEHEQRESDGACNLQELKLLLERKFVELRKTSNAMEAVEYDRLAEDRVEEAYWDKDCQRKADAMDKWIADGGCDELAAVLAAPQWRGSCSSQFAPGVTARDPSECTKTALDEE